MNAEWYAHWFDEDYLALYPQRDAAEARDQAQALAPQLPSGRLLDLACGEGRHSRWLGREIRHVLGVDLSFALLSRARAGGLAVTRGDMRRLPFKDNVFATVLSLFTSYGYFASGAEDRAVLAEVARVLAPGGRFVLDYLNLPWVLANLVSHEVRQAGNESVTLTRRWDARRHRLEKLLRWSEGGREREVLESLRGYEPAELEGDVVAAGFSIEFRWGDFDASPLTPQSPRCILFARRQA